MNFITLLPEVISNRIVSYLHNNSLNYNLFDLLLVSRRWRNLIISRFHHLTIIRPFSSHKFQKQIGFINSEHFHRIKYVRISYVAFNEEIESLLGQTIRISSSHLQSISMTFCRISDQSLRRLFVDHQSSSLLNLNKLDLRFNKITLKGFQFLYQYFSSLKGNSLRSINLSHNSLYLPLADGEAIFTESNGSRNKNNDHWRVEKINISFNHVDFRDIVQVIGEESLQWLRSLILSTSLIDDSCANWDRLIRISGLSRLDLQGTILNGGCLEFLLETLSVQPRLSNITDLSLSGQKLLRQSMSKLERMISNNEWIRKLNLSDCNLSDKGCDHLAKAIENNFSIQELIFSRNNITQKGGSLLLDACSKNHSLTSLDISYNQLGPNSCLEIQNFIRLSPSIRMLELSYNGIQSNDITNICFYLLNNLTLTHLNLRGNHFQQSIVLPFYKVLLSKESQNNLIIDLSQNKLIWVDKRTHKNLIIN